jgi:O-antigen/teichoic acid export membrane protein
VNEAIASAQRRLLPHVLALAAGDGLTRALVAVGWIYLARVLGGPGLGALEFTLGVLAYFQLATTAGLDWTGMRSIAQGRPAALAARELTVLRLALASASFALLLAVAWALPQPGVGRLLACYGVLLFSGAASLRWAFLAEERGQAVAVLGVLGQLFFLAGIVVLVRGPDDLGRLPWIQLASELLVVGGLAVGFRRALASPAPPSPPRPWTGLLRESLPIGLTQMFGQAIFNADVILLGFLGYLAQVGYYAAAYRIVTLLQVIPTAYFTAIFPALARSHGSRRSPPGSDLPRRTAYYALAASMPVALVLVDCSGWIVELLFGSSFRASAAPLRWLAWSLPAVTFRAVFRNLLLTSHQEVTNLLLSFLTALFNVVLNLALIPPFGIVGAAVATLASEMLLLGAAAWRVRASLGPLGILRPSVGPLVASAAMAAILSVAPGGAVPRLALAGVGYWLALAVSRRVWTVG